MDGRWAAGSPLLCRTLLAALLLLPGAHLEAESTAISQSTQDTSTAPPHTLTELSESKEVTVTPSGTLTSVPTEEAKTNISTEILDKNISTNNNLDSATTVSGVPTTIKANNSSDSNGTAVTPTNTNGVSINPNTTSVTSTVSINTNSEPSTLSEHTSGPTLSSQPPSSPQTSSLTPSSPTPSSPTQSNTETITKIIETGSTDKIGSTSTNTTATSFNPVTQESTSPFDKKSSPTDGSESKTVSTTPALTPKDTSTADATTEHNVKLPSALSPGSVAAITIIVILLVLVIFGGAAYWKIRHSSYGRLLEDQDYGSLGNYNNPLYDDS